MENNIRVLQKIIYRITIWSSNITFWVDSVKNWKQSWRDYCTPTFTITKRWKQPKCPSMNKWISKMRYIHTRDYSVLKRKEILTHATVWMNPWAHYAKWNKTVTKGQILYNPTYMGYLESSESWRQKVGGWLPGTGGRAKWAVVQWVESFSFTRWESSGDVLLNSDTVEVFTWRQLG